MSSYSIDQIAKLTTAMVEGYPTATGQADIKMLLATLSVEFDRFATPNATFELTLNAVLLNLNQSTGLSALLVKLTQDARPAVLDAINQMSVATPAPHLAGFDELSNELLMIEGDPFINHENLAKKLLPSLIDTNSPLRAVVMTGPIDSGKTFSLGLIRRLCRDAAGARRFRPLAIDLRDLALTRDCLELAKTVALRLKLDQFELPRADTSDPRVGQRLVTELAAARELSDNILPTLLVFDHLDKDVAPVVVDFVEQLALAAASGALRDVRVVLIGFPRAPAPAFQPGKLSADTVVQPNPALLFQYVDRVLGVLNRDIDDQSLNNLVNGVFAGQQQPYPRPFMLELPEKVRGLLNDIMRAPTHGG
jgi:hypothetical protein